MATPSQPAYLPNALRSSCRDVGCVVILLANAYGNFCHRRHKQGKLAFSTTFVSKTDENRRGAPQSNPTAEFMPSSLGRVLGPLAVIFVSDIRWLLICVSRGSNRSACTATTRHWRVAPRTYPPVGLFCVAQSCASHSAQRQCAMHTRQTTNWTEL